MQLRWRGQVRVPGRVPITVGKVQHAVLLYIGNIRVREEVQHHLSPNTYCPLIVIRLTLSGRHWQDLAGCFLVDSGGSFLN